MATRWYIVAHTFVSSVRIAMCLFRANIIRAERNELSDETRRLRPKMVCDASDDMSYAFAISSGFDTCCGCVGTVGSLNIIVSLGTEKRRRDCACWLTAMTTGAGIFYLKNIRRGKNTSRVSRELLQKMRKNPLPTTRLLRAFVVQLYIYSNILLHFGILLYRDLYICYRNIYIYFFFKQWLLKAYRSDLRSWWSSLRRGRRSCDARVLRSFLAAADCPLGSAGHFLP